MVQFVFLSGKMAGTAWVTRLFPVHAGRAPGNDLLLEEPGVHDRHFVITLTPSNTLEFSVIAPALATVNGHPVTCCNLRHGDLVQAGSSRLRFWLAPTRQTSLLVSQFSLWASWIAVLGVQFVLLRWLNF